MQAALIAQQIPPDRYDQIAWEGQQRGLGRISLKTSLSDHARSIFSDEIKINPCRFRLPHVKDYMASKCS